jgi:hypothetical protein
LDAAVAATAFLFMLGAFEGLTVEVLVDFVVVFLAVVVEDFWAGLLVCFVVVVDFFFVLEELEPELSEAL